MLSGVLNERRATALTYDAALDVIQVSVSSAHGVAATKRVAAAALLLDASGFLVGVDVGAEGPSRIVVMLGPHEAVASVQPARVEILEASGDLLEVHVTNAKASCRANEANPYA